MSKKLRSELPANEQEVGKVLEDDAPTKWGAPIVGYPVRDKDGKIVEIEGMPKLTKEQKCNVIENTEYFRGKKP